MEYVLTPSPIYWSYSFSAQHPIDTSLHNTPKQTSKRVETSVNIAQQTIMRQLRQSTSTNYYIKKIDCMDGLGAHFTNASWAYTPILATIHVALTQKVMFQSGHKFTRTMTAKLSWHVQICGLTIKFRMTTKRFLWYFTCGFINCLKNGSPIQRWWCL